MNEINQLKKEMIEQLQEKLYLDQEDVDLLNKVLEQGLIKAKNLNHEPNETRKD